MTKINGAKAKTNRSNVTPRARAPANKLLQLAVGARGAEVAILPLLLVVWDKRLKSLPPPQLFAVIYSLFLSSILVILLFGFISATTARYLHYSIGVIDHQIFSARKAATRAGLRRW